MEKDATRDQLRQKIKELELKIDQLKKDHDLQEQIHQLIRFAPHGMYLIDLKGRIAMANETGARHYMKTLEEFVGTVIRDYSPTDVAEHRQKMGLEVVASGHATTFEDLVGNRWYKHHIFPIRDDKGSVTHLAIYGTDVTEYRSALEVLQKTNDRYRDLYESSRDGYAMVNMNGKVLESNSVFREMLGYTKEELESVIYENVTPEKWRDREMKIIREQVLTRGYSDLYEKEYIKKDGTVFPIETRTYLLRDENGRRIGMWAFVRDISEQKKLTDQLYQAQKMEAIGTLAGGIAHDFNNLLMGIQGRASLLLTDIDATNPHYEHLRGIEKYIKSASKLTRQLLGFARGGKYEVKPTNLNEIIDKCLDMFGRTQKEISIHRQYESELWLVDVDRGQMEQVLMNLFVNAWQAMPAGGNLFIKTRNVHLNKEQIKPFQAKTGQYVKISVTDTGTGMDDTTKEKIFDPFFTTKPRERGTGLGLASVYGIINNHEGIVDVNSELGIGTTFDIYLPVTDKKLEENVDLKKEIPSGSEVILLIDDEEMILEVCGEMLEELGYQVIHADSGEKALDIFQQKQDDIDLIILDMIMPGMGGQESYNRIKRINPDVKVILSSGYSLNEQTRKILDQGCDGFIQKPFNLDDLSTKLREILDPEE